MTAPRHGGDLRAALAAAGIADSPGWIDLSTGINPHAYPMPDLREATWTRLPGAADLAALNEAARACFEAPADAGVVAAAGTELLINLLPAHFSVGDVCIVGPTYSSHAIAWQRAGHDVRNVSKLDEADGAIVVLTNPNNPDGRMVGADMLAAFADGLTRKDGWLIVDEAFADAVPDISAVKLTARSNTIVLRSFGKFFGLAGLRLGFAVAPAAMAQQLEAGLGAWPVSGPAAAIGARALADTEWQTTMKDRLARAASSLDDRLSRAGVGVAGGTSLFRFICDPRAGALFDALWGHRILVRRFEEDTEWLRIGLPDDAGIERLSQALADFAREQT